MNSRTAICAVTVKGEVTHATGYLIDLKEVGRDIDADAMLEALHRASAQATFVVLAVVLRGPMGHVGISVAVAGSSAAQMLLLFGALKARLPRLHAVPCPRA